MTALPPRDLLSRVVAGEIAAIGRLMSHAEAGKPEARPMLAEIYRRAGRAHVVGITGVPGSGKSTLVGKLAQKLRALDVKVGIVAIDPSSPYSGGSILGDRVRMSDLAADPGIFIRSMATRGAVGGMARAALDAVDILDVAGFGLVILETVGVGQDEVEVAKASHTTVVVSAPGLGDEVQAIKAGIMEIADIHVVSKCDRSDANRTLKDLRTTLMLAIDHGERPPWEIPIIGTSSVSGEGIDELIDAIGRHRKIAFETDAGQARKLAIARFRLLKTAENMLADRFNRLAARESLKLAPGLSRREGDLYSAAEALLDSYLTWEQHDDHARPIKSA
jgi:LAO/AO transport system kinase